MEPKLPDSKPQVFSLNSDHLASEKRVVKGLEFFTGGVKKLLDNGNNNSYIIRDPRKPKALDVKSRKLE